MTTSKPYRICLFKKEGCAPCFAASEALDRVLALHPEYDYIITTFQKENHPALVAAYELELYPTAIIFDSGTNELGRKIGGKFITFDWWSAALSAIHGSRTGSGDAPVHVGQFDV
jgi:hypothetical protein